MRSFMLAAALLGLSGNGAPAATDADPDSTFVAPARPPRPQRPVAAAPT